MPEMACPQAFYPIISLICPTYPTALKPKYLKPCVIWCLSFTSWRSFSQELALYRLSGKLSKSSVSLLEILGNLPLETSKVTGCLPRLLGFKEVDYPFLCINYNTG